jgi:DNA-binding FadR family transcriptional regulator
MGDSPNPTVFAPVAAPSTYAHTVERLGTAIRIGVLAPGTRLPPERDLAEQLGISRSTLRQALATLTASGHLRAVRGRSGGTFVAETPPVASPAPFPLEHSRAVLDWRMTLELAAAELAATRADLLSHEALAEAADRFMRPEITGDWPQFRRADAAFHVRLAVASGSDRMVAAMTGVHGELNDLFHQVPPPVEARAATAADHLAVVTAIGKRDPQAAREAMREHCARTERIVDQLSTSAA